MPNKWIGWNDFQAGGMPAFFVSSLAGSRSGPALLYSLDLFVLRNGFFPVMTG